MSTVQARTATAVVEFDGRVLEVFSREGSTRVLASDLTYTRSEPDKKGRVSVSFASFGQGVVMLLLTEDYVPDVEALLAALDAAGVQRS